MRSLRIITASELNGPLVLRHELALSPSVRSTRAVPSTTAFSDTAEAGSACLPISASASGTGIFARAFSSMSFSSDAKVSPVAEAERELYELEQFGEERRGLDGEEWT